MEYPHLGTVSKKRYTFIYKKQYFKLDIIDNALALLEVNPISSKSKINLPDKLSILKEVTDDTDYDNATLAKKHSKQYVNK